MAENIKVKNTDGTEIADIAPYNPDDANAPGVEDKFDTTLVGENVQDYMVEINNNFVGLLENFAGDTAPPKASDGGSVEGQIWYDKANDNINYKNSSEWTSNADAIGGKTLDEVREYTLSGLDTTGKLSKTGGTLTGEMNVNGAVQVRKSILPNLADNSFLGGQNNRFRNIYLKEDGIKLGDSSKGLTFKPHNYVYAVDSDSDRVDGFPKGAIILHQETGEAIIKKSTGKFNKNNNTFRKLADDKQNSATIGGNKFKFMGEIGLIAGGWGSGYSYRNPTIEKITIATTGNSVNFGNLTYGRAYMGEGMSSGVRGVFQGGWAYTNNKSNGRMDYVTFATPGNATSFGTLGYENYGSACVSDGTRGIIGPGYNGRSNGPRGHHYVAAYITIETPGNASKFGTIKNGYWACATASGTRGVFSGYSRSGWNRKLEYITIQTPGNSSYFGTVSQYCMGSMVTDAIKGVIMGGWSTRGWNNIEYVTLATTGNGVNFGRLRGSSHLGSGVSNGVRGVLTHRWWNSTAEYITIATPGNSAHFGSMRMSRSSASSASGN